MSDDLNIGDLVYDNNALGLVIEKIPINDEVISYDYLIDWLHPSACDQGYCANTTVLKRWRKNYLDMRENLYR